MQLVGVAFVSRRVGALLSAAAAFLLVLAGGEVVLHSQLQDRMNKQHIETLSYATTLRTRVERELNALLYLSSGIGAYLVVRNRSMQAGEIHNILEVLHRNSRNVRSFGVAIGYRVRHVYPLIGNEKAIGLNYPDQPGQWPVIQKIASTGHAALAGPVALVQGGRGLVYRVPLMLDGRYWGLLSTVIDSDALFQAVSRESADGRFEYAIRGKDGLGLAGEAVWGALALFDAPDALLQEMDVPGGRWVIAVRGRVQDDPGRLQWLLRLGSGAVGLLIAWMLYMLVRNRGLMAHWAMYDGLTGLPNRRLFEDRALMAFSRQQRRQDQFCALLFLDLDDFKRINDERGHKAGDAVLQEIARRATAAVRQNDTVARWGGDEFIVLLENVTRPMLDMIAQRLRRDIQEPIDFVGRALQVGVSIGVAICPATGAELDELLHMADENMYGEKTRRKAAGGG